MPRGAGEKALPPARDAGGDARFDFRVVDATMMYYVVTAWRPPHPSMWSTMCRVYACSV